MVGAAKTVIEVKALFLLLVWKSGKNRVCSCPLVSCHIPQLDEDTPIFKFFLCVHQRVSPFCFLSASQNTFSVACSVMPAESCACYFICSLLCPTEFSVALIICAPMGYHRMCSSIAWWEEGSFSLFPLLHSAWRSVLFLRLPVVPFFFGDVATMGVI